MSNPNDSISSPSKITGVGILDRSNIFFMWHFSSHDRHDYTLTPGRLETGEIEALRSCHPEKENSPEISSRRAAFKRVFGLKQPALHS